MTKKCYVILAPYICFERHTAVFNATRSCENQNGRMEIKSARVKIQNARMEIKFAGVKMHSACMEIDDGHAVM